VSAEDRAETIWFRVGGTGIRRIRHGTDCARTMRPCESGFLKGLRPN
jgi:hypothetical protein